MRIAHLADIQVRAHSRHEEFEESFLHLYRSLEEKKPDRIVLAGDIVHNKTNISPELVDVVARFFRNLCQIAPVDLILGNHDLAMKNQERLDALTPIVRALADKRLFFYRSSQLMKVDNNFQYVIMSCLDDEKTWNSVREAALLYPDRVSIALWHGTINGIDLDNGTKLESKHGLELFKGLDYAMLGDIHKTQVLDPEQRFAYPGSYPKQNFGEGEKGGYFLWDIQDKDKHELKFVELPTVCPYYTIALHTAPDVPSFDWFKKGARIRIKSRYLNAAERKIVKDRVAELYAPCELKFQFEGAEPANIVIADNVQVENLRDTKAQEKLLREYLPDLTAPELEKLYSINQACPVSNAEVVRNVRYKILRYGFGGMFSFGEPKNDKDGLGHYVDLVKHKGIVGVFGKNAAGKSSLAVDVPLYCLFNKISKDVSRNQHYINDRSERCSVAMDLAVNGKMYSVNRWSDLKRTKKRDGSVQESTETQVVFKECWPDYNHCGIDRPETEKAIRSLFGSADDFLLTSVAAQFDLLGFVACKAAERKKTIARYFDLEVFEEKHKQANETLRAMKKQLQSLENVDFDAQIDGLKAQARELHKKIDKADKQEASARRLYDFARGRIESIKAMQKDSVVWRKHEGVTIKADYVRNKQLLAELTAEMEEFDTYACLRNPDCCLAERRKVVAGKLLKAEAAQESVKQKLVAFVEEMKQAEADAAPHLEKLKEATLLCEQHSQNAQEARNAQLALTREETMISCRIKALEKQKDDLDKLQEDFKLQEVYVKAMGKDGLSYRIISRNLGRINREIEAILGTDMHFSMWLEDDDKEINVYFQNEGQKARLIELCSGMERTIAAIAIRAALISVTTLPVSNVFVLDESFTSLDTEHMDALGRVLSGLKRIFDTIIIICHNEYAKDLCDSIITVDMDEEGFSQINAA
jgi:DNA repair exonuclease SbcCD ATPase subunit/DNA repair exonuclease SbcCD nuclease subunit